MFGGVRSWHVYACVHLHVCVCVVPTLVLAAVVLPTAQHPSSTCTLICDVGCFVYVAGLVVAKLMAPHECDREVTVAHCHTEILAHWHTDRLTHPRLLGHTLAWNEPVLLSGRGAQDESHQAVRPT